MKIVVPKADLNEAFNALIKFPPKISILGVIGPPLNNPPFFLGTASDPPGQAASSHIWTVGQYKIGPR